MEGAEECAGFDVVRAYSVIALEMEHVPVLSNTTSSCSGIGLKG